MLCWKGILIYRFPCESSSSKIEVIDGSSSIHLDVGSCPDLVKEEGEESSKDKILLPNICGESLSDVLILESHDASKYLSLIRGGEDGEKMKYIRFGYLNISSLRSYVKLKGVKPSKSTHENNEIMVAKYQDGSYFIIAFSTSLIWKEIAKYKPTDFSMNTSLDTSHGGAGDTKKGVSISGLYLTNDPRFREVEPISRPLMSSSPTPENQTSSKIQAIQNNNLSTSSINSTPCKINKSGNGVKEESCDVLTIDSSPSSACNEPLITPIPKRNQSNQTLSSSATPFVPTTVTHQITSPNAPSVKSQNGGFQVVGVRAELIKVTPPDAKRTVRDINYNLPTTAPSPPILKYKTESKKQEVIQKKKVEETNVLTIPSDPDDDEDSFEAQPKKKSIRKSLVPFFSDSSHPKYATLNDSISSAATPTKTTKIDQNSFSLRIILGVGEELNRFNKLFPNPNAHPAKFFLHPLIHSSPFRLVTLIGDASDVFRLLHLMIENVFGADDRSTRMISCLLVIDRSYYQAIVGGESKNLLNMRIKSEASISLADPKSLNLYSSDIMPNEIIVYIRADKKSRVLAATKMVVKKLVKEFVPLKKTQIPNLNFNVLNNNNNNIINIDMPKKEIPSLIGDREEEYNSEFDDDGVTANAHRTTYAIKILIPDDYYYVVKNVMPWLVTESGIEEVVKDVYKREVHTPLTVRGTARALREFLYLFSKTMAVTFAGGNVSQFVFWIVLNSEEFYQQDKKNIDEISLIAGVSRGSEQMPLVDWGGNFYNLLTALSYIMLFK